MTHTILITGATGTVGGQIARELLADPDIRVRVGSRRPEALASLADRGAEPVRLDLEDPTTFAAAFDGVDRLFLVGPQGHEGFGADVAPILAAARAAGVHFVVRLSALGASEDADLTLAREHGRGERATRESGIDFAILQPTFFQDNLLKFQGEALAEKSAFFGASGDGQTAYVSSADIARCAAAILRAPDDHLGKTYVLTGPAAVSDTELARQVSDVTGRQLRYVDLGPDGLLAAMLAQGTPEWFARSLVAFEKVKALGYASEVSPAVEQITGRAPEVYRSFLERNRTQII